jgi:hypothetical protein
MEEGETGAEVAFIKVSKSVSCYQWKFTVRTLPALSISAPPF